MLTHCLTQTGRLLGCHAYFRKINYTPYGAGTHPLNVFSVLARSATAQPACSSGWGAGGQALRRPQESGGSRPCQRAPILLSIHQPPPRESHCSRPAGSRREGPGLALLEHWASPGMPLEAQWPMHGKAWPCAHVDGCPHPRFSSFPYLLFRGFWLPSKRRRTASTSRDQGREPGAAGPAETPARSPWALPAPPGRS